MPVGLKVNLNVEGEQMTMSYRIKGGGELIVSSGVIGSGVSCELAATSVVTWFRLRRRPNVVASCGTTALSTRWHRDPDS